MSSTYPCCGRERKWSRNSHAPDCPVAIEQHDRMVAITRERKAIARTRTRQSGGPVLMVSECPHGNGADCGICAEYGD